MSLYQFYPKNPQFLFFTAVADPYKLTAELVTNEELRALQLQDLVLHYLVNLSSDGDYPVEGYGSHGLIRKTEAERMRLFYEITQVDETYAWVCLPDGRRVWSKSGGWDDPPTGPYTYQDMLDSLGFQVVTGDHADPQMRLLTASTRFYGFVVNLVLAGVFGKHREYANNRLAMIGSTDHTHSMAVVPFPASRLPDIQAVLPLQPDPPVYAEIQDAGHHMIWNNIQGDTPPGPVEEPEDFAEDEGYRILYLPPVVNE